MLVSYLIWFLILVVIVVIISVAIRKAPKVDEDTKQLLTYALYVFVAISLILILTGTLPPIGPRHL